MAPHPAPPPLPLPPASSSSFVGGLPLLLVLCVAFTVGYGLSGQPSWYSLLTVTSPLPSSPLEVLEPLPPPLPTSASAAPIPSSTQSPLHPMLAGCKEVEGYVPPADYLKALNGALGSPGSNARLAEWWAKQPPSQPLPPIALGVQGNSGNCREVQRNYAAWPAELRANVSLFLLAYDAEFDCAPSVEASVAAGAPPHAACLFAPGTSWTAGRNVLARSIFQAERARGAVYSRWVFSDQDVANPGGLRCNGLGEGTTACTDDGTSAAAWGALVRTLLLPLDYPLLTMVSPSLPVQNVMPPDPPSPSSTCAQCVTFLNSDCGDAAINSFDRDAVPLFLPYLTDVDSHSWWSSQAILFHLKKGCLGGHGGWITGIDPGIFQHLPYPNGRPLDLELAAVRATFPTLYEWPLKLPPAAPPTITAEYEQGNCNPAHKMAYVHHDAGNLSHVEASRAWRTAPEFQACLRAALPRFCGFAKNVTQPAAEAGSRGPWP
jgi:hypothetical protein